MIKVGVIGMGQMGYYHAKIYNSITGVELVAICEYDDDKRKEYEKEFNCKSYKDYNDLLNDSEVEAVSIVLPDNIHTDCLEKAINAKKHILVEKPLCKELDDGNKIYELAKDYDKVFTVGYLLRYDVRFNRIKKSLDNGELGDIIHIYARRNSPIIGPRRYIGASDLSMHVMSHDIDYVNWFMGCLPSKVYARSNSVLLKEYGMDDVIYALLSYDNGAIVCLEACWTLPESSPTIIDDKVELVGTKGVAYVDSCDQGLKLVTNEKVLYPDTRHWYYVGDEVMGDLAEEIRGFVSSIKNNTKPLVSVKDGYNSLLIVDAIERSIREGKEVEIKR